jgi:hypothetical protein
MSKKKRSTRKLEAMNFDHPRWMEFVVRLNGPEGVNCRAVDGTPVSWTCNGDFQATSRVLKLMGGLDITQSLEFFKSEGGYCDCEVLMNVDTKYRELIGVN